MAWAKYDGTFKDLWEKKNQAATCFKSAAKKGDTTWQDGGKLLRLDDSNTWWTSGGYLTFTVGTGWKLALRITTENVDWFQDEIDPAYLIDEGKLADGEYPPFPSDEEDAVVWESAQGILGENDSELFIMLNAGDILLIDVDAEHTQWKKSFRIRKDGKEYIADYGDNSVRVNDDTWVRMLDAFYWVEDAEPTGTSTTSDEGDGDVTIPVEVTDEVVITDEVIDNPVPNPDKDPDNPQDSFKEDEVLDPSTPTQDGGGNGGGGGDNGGGDEPEEDKTLRNIIFISIMGILAFMVFRVVRMNGGDKNGE